MAGRGQPERGTSHSSAMRGLINQQSDAKDIIRVSYSMTERMAMKIYEINQDVSKLAKSTSKSVNDLSFIPPFKVSQEGMEYP